MAVHGGPPTPEELAAAKAAMPQGTPIDVLVGFVMARRGGDVKGMYERREKLESLSQELSDVLKTKTGDSPHAERYSQLAEDIVGGVRKMYGKDIDDHA